MRGSPATRRDISRRRRLGRTGRERRYAAIVIPAGIVVSMYTRGALSLKSDVAEAVLGCMGTACRRAGLSGMWLAGGVRCG